jgi:hypothetical protein
LGLPPYSVATSAASESAPFLKSTGRVATITFVPGAGPIIAAPAMPSARQLPGRALLRVRSDHCARHLDLDRDIIR